MMADSVQERLVQLRQEALALEPSDPARAQIVVELSQLYSDAIPYPADPTLYEWEVSKVDTTAAASGGFGNCWKGLFLGQHQVAMKCSRSYIAPEIAMRRLEREMNVWKRLRHPNILPFIGFIILASPVTTLFMISPWMENGNLGVYIKANPDADRLRLLTEIATGLEYLHTSEVVHGDLKAANILISKIGDARIADFGLSEIIVEEDGDRQRHSSAWEGGGNPRWQAPELFGTRRGTKSSDIFAFGRVIYEVYAGMIPFAELQNHQVYAVVEAKELPIRPHGKNSGTRGFSEEMWQFMACCCKTKSSERPEIHEIVVYLLSLPKYLDAAHAIKSPEAGIFTLAGRMVYLRQEVLTLERSDPARAELIIELSHLYADSKYYPADPTLYEWELSIVDTSATASGGFGDCWKGLFLGQHPVAMKCSRSVAPKIAMRVNFFASDSVLSHSLNVIHLES
ncbi:hypothetical protein BOTBODRAFT_598442 [Botryobasidium botryosum FD-172 SS1]|uniref:Protein kinase domain-containing protein n=1 Tax=Botryobasidium botryosum (strain FD-172 SS1) TaxID=930990 RepID=A0A067M7P5_BOTB1|nr:hypothetical protein BOTBODRAFT_598442 [Botryobasidium botryosum FD-172 SS1]